MALILFFFLPISTAIKVDNLTLNLTVGRVKGRLSVSDHGEHYVQFLGIPYALPPLGEMRFREPQPAVPWTNMFDGTKAPPSCPQPKVSAFFNDKYDDPHIEDHRRQRLRNIQVVGKEDCLKLNIYKPGTMELKIGTDCH